MKRWALVVAALYLLILVILTVPVTLLAFAPDANVKDIAEAYTQFPYWLWIGVMVLGQAALLVVPVRVASRRPVTRRSLLLPIVTAGLIMGGLVVGAMYSLYESAQTDIAGRWLSWAVIGSGVVIWCVWGILFYRSSRGVEPSDLISRQCRLMFRGSVLELLIAVPTHIVARSRDHCCAGGMTFIGIILGISVMLFSFGPAVFFLYAARWRRLHPEVTIQPEQMV